MFLPSKVFLVLSTVLLLASALTQRAFSQSPSDETTATTTGTITGRVMNDSGQPVAHATIFVTGSAGPSQQRTTVTDDAGNFQVSGLDASLYFVRASAPTYLSAPIDPEDGLFPTYRIGDSVNINLIKGGVITGTVTWATGQPLVQAWVRAIMIRDAKGKPPTGPGFRLERSTDDRGIYRMFGLLPGPFLVCTGGTVDAPQTGSATVKTSPAQTLNGNSQLAAITYQLGGSRGFTFYGIADGEYDLTAQYAGAPGELQASEPMHISVKGRDVAGLGLSLKAPP